MTKVKNSQQVQLELSKAIEKIAGENPVFEIPANKDHGDLTSSVALKIGSKNKENPRNVAQEIVDKLNLPKEISKVEVAGAGFINFTYSDSYLMELLEAPEIFIENKPEKQTIVVDYSSPNVAKPLGVHHLMSTVIGQSLINILKFKGNKTVSVNYIGDWGTQFGKLIFAFKKWGDKAEVEKNAIPELLKLYVKFHDEAEKDVEIEAGGRMELKKLEGGDEENRKLWEWIVNLSIEYSKNIYEMLGGIKFDSWRGEAACEPDLKDILDEGKKSGIFVEGEEGSYVVDLAESNLPPFLVQKGDGTTLYSTRDILTVKHRLKTCNPDKLIYVVDVAQKLHFEQLFSAIKKFGWYKSKVDYHHLIFGRMKFKDMQMSTRKGNIISLEEVLNDAVKRAAEIIAQKNPDLENKDETARMIGTGAVKYSILSQSPETDIIFDWDKIMNLEGNSAPYLQYSYARAASILRATEAKKGSLKKDYNLLAEEAAVIRKATAFLGVIDEAATKFKPNLVANFLYEFAQVFNAFYGKCRVREEENEEVKKIRFSIVGIFAEIMKTGLHLLGGIEAPERM